MEKSDSATSFPPSLPIPPKPRRTDEELAEISIISESVLLSNTATPLEKQQHIDSNEDTLVNEQPYFSQGNEVKNSCSVILGSTDNPLDSSGPMEYHKDSATPRSHQSETSDMSEIHLEHHALTNAKLPHNILTDGSSTSPKDGTVPLAEKPMQVVRSNSVSSKKSWLSLSSVTMKNAFNTGDCKHDGAIGTLLQVHETGRNPISSISAAEACLDSHNVFTQGNKNYTHPNRNLQVLNCADGAELPQESKTKSEECFHAGNNEIDDELLDACDATSATESNREETKPGGSGTLTLLCSNEVIKEKENVAALPCAESANIVARGRAVFFKTAENAAASGDKKYYGTKDMISDVNISNAMPINSELMTSSGFGYKSERFGVEKECNKDVNVAVYALGKDAGVYEVGGREYEDLRRDGNKNGHYKANMSECKGKSRESRATTARSAFAYCSPFPCAVFAYCQHKIVLRSNAFLLLSGILALAFWLLAVCSYSWRFHELKYEDEKGKHTVVTNAGLFSAQRIQQLETSDGSIILMYDMPACYTDLQNSEFCADKQNGSSESSRSVSINGVQLKALAADEVPPDTNATPHFRGGKVDFISRESGAIGALNKEDAQTRKELLGGIVWDLECKHLDVLKNAGKALWIIAVIICVFQVIGLTCDLFLTAYTKVYASYYNGNKTTSKQLPSTHSTASSDIDNIHCKRNTYHNLQWFKYISTAAWLLSWVLLVIGLAVWGNLTDKAICTSESGGSEVCSLGGAAIVGIISLIFSSLCLVLQCVRYSNKNVFHFCNKCYDRGVSRKQSSDLKVSSMHKLMQHQRTPSIIESSDGDISCCNGEFKAENTEQCWAPNDEQHQNNRSNRGLVKKY